MYKIIALLVIGHRSLVMAIEINQFSLKIPQCIAEYKHRVYDILSRKNFNPTSLGDIVTSFDDNFNFQLKNTKAYGVGHSLSDALACMYGYLNPSFAINQHESDDKFCLSLNDLKDLKNLDEITFTITNTTKNLEWNDNKKTANSVLELTDNATGDTNEDSLYTENVEVTIKWSYFFWKLDNTEAGFDTDQSFQILGHILSNSLFCDKDNDIYLYAQDGASMFCVGESDIDSARFKAHNFFKWLVSGVPQDINSQYENAIDSTWQRLLNNDGTYENQLLVRLNMWVSANEAVIATFDIPVFSFDLSSGVFDFGTYSPEVIVDSRDTNTQLLLESSICSYVLQSWQSSLQRSHEQPLRSHENTQSQKPKIWWRSTCKCGVQHEVPFSVLSNPKSPASTQLMVCECGTRHTFYKECNKHGYYFAKSRGNTYQTSTCPKCR